MSSDKSANENDLKTVMECIMKVRTETKRLSAHIVPDVAPIESKDATVLVTLEQMSKRVAVYSENSSNY